MLLISSIMQTRLFLNKILFFDLLPFFQIVYLMQHFLSELRSLIGLFYMKSDLLDGIKFFVSMPTEYFQLQLRSMMSIFFDLNVRCFNFLKIFLLLTMKTRFFCLIIISNHQRLSYAGLS